MPCTVQQALVKRLAKFALALKPTNQGPTLSGTCNHRGHFEVGWRTDKTRVRRSLTKCHQLLQSMRQEPSKDQAEQGNQGL